MTTPPVTQEEKTDVPEGYVVTKDYVMPDDGKMVNKGKICKGGMRKAPRKKQAMAWSQAQPDIKVQADLCCGFTREDLGEAWGVWENGGPTPWKDTIADDWNKDNDERDMWKQATACQMLSWLSQSILDLPDSYKLKRMRENAQQLLGYSEKLKHTDTPVNWVGQTLDQMPDELWGRFYRGNFIDSAEYSRWAFMNKAERDACWDEWEDALNAQNEARLVLGRRTTTAESA
jgi:predicted Fe-S protein YdhL (DUF1289 family)